MSDPISYKCVIKSHFWCEMDACTCECHVGTILAVTDDVVKSYKRHAHIE